MYRKLIVLLVLILALSSCSLLPKKAEIVLPELKSQWADSAYASSSTAGIYGANRDDQSPTAATGEPDVLKCMDDLRAWATEDADEGMQWIELKYYDELHVTKVRVKESLAPGSVAKIELKDGNDYVVLWEGVDDRRHKDCPGFFEKSFSVKQGNLTLNMTPFKTDTIRLTLNTDIPDWNEIDAVEMQGYANKWYFYNSTLVIE